MKGLKEELSQDLKKRVVMHRERFKKLFYARYKEMLPSLIVYNDGNHAIDFLKCEVALRNNYHVAIGENIDGVIMVLGYVINDESSEDPTNFLVSEPLTKEDIKFIIPYTKIPLEMSEISNMDNCTTGNFVVLRNKTLNYINDNEVIRHYTDELAEIVLSRYSIAMQAKIGTFFVSDANDNTVNNLIADLYNGAPFHKTTGFFDARDNMFSMDNQHMAANFVELKREYQNKISELNNMLGINSLGVEKASGVSDAEAKSNRAFTTSTSNIYLLARNEPLKRLNKRFGRDIEAVYNDEVESEFTEKEEVNDI